MTKARQYLYTVRLVLATGSLRAILLLVNDCLRVILRIYLGALYGKKWRGIMSDGFEANISRLVMRIRGNLAVDVGAQFGWYTIPFASHFERVIAVEPNPTNLPILRQRLKGVKVENVRIVASAVADFEGETELYIQPEGGVFGGASIVVSRTSLRTHFCVPVITLDTLLLGEGQVDLVKVDTESAEWQILRGAQNSLRKIKRWMIELHDMRRMKEFDSLLKSSGYETRWVLDLGPSLHVLATRPGLDDT